MKSIASLLAVALMGLSAPAVPGCGSSTKAPAPQAAAKPASKSLYTRLGGEAAIAAVVNDFVNRALTDPAVNLSRRGEAKERDTSPEAIARLKTLLVEQIGEAAGGPRKYTGRSMKEAHKGQNITEAQFDALATHLVLSLRKFRVGDAEIAELIAIVAAMKGDIVERWPEGSSV